MLNLIISFLILTLAYSQCSAPTPYYEASSATCYAGIFIIIKYVHGILPLITTLTHLIIHAWKHVLEPIMALMAIKPVYKLVRRLPTKPITIV